MIDSITPSKGWRFELHIENDVILVMAFVPLQICWSRTYSLPRQAASRVASKHKVQWEIPFP
jgi:hypothetical protein